MRITIHIGIFTVTIIIKKRKNRQPGTVTVLIVI